VPFSSGQAAGIGDCIDEDAVEDPVKFAPGRRFHLPELETPFTRTTCPETIEGVFASPPGRSRPETPATRAAHFARSDGQASGVRRV